MRVIGIVGADLRLPEVNTRETAPAVWSARPVKFATPFETVAVAWTSNPEPPAAEAVMTVLLSPVSTLPNWSSSTITGWLVKG